MKQVKKDIISVCQKLYEKNLLASCDGNVSCKIDSDIFITPSGVPKSSLTILDILSIGLNGEIRESLTEKMMSLLRSQIFKTKPLSPSSEKEMHVFVYKNNKESRAVIHAHPPYAVSLSLARPNWREIPPALSEVVLALGKIPIIPYTRPGTKAMGAALSPFLKEAKAFILSGHGALTWGENLDEAYLAMERLEHTSQMIYLAEALGGSRELPEEELKALWKIRESFKNKVL